MFNKLQRGPIPYTLLNYTRQYPQPNEDILKNEQLRKYDFMLLPGYMIKFAILYHQLPTYDHWMWSHYPDGEEWKHRFDHLLSSSYKNQDSNSVSLEQVIQVISRSQHDDEKKPG